jgi:peptide/nickel transport system permease protein
MTLAFSFRKNLRMVFGFLVVTLIILLAIFAPLISMDPLQMSLAEKLLPPSSSHWFGLDQNGSDVFAQIFYGARVSLYIALVVVFVSASIGLCVGSLAGFNGGWVDQIIMRLIDMIYAFPGFLLALSLVAVLGPSVNNVILAMCLTSWTSFARLVRGEILHLKTRDFIQGAVAMGASPLRQLVYHIWPNLFGILVVQMTFAMAGTIIAESGLSFLGLGAPATTPTWGALLNAGRRSLQEAPHISIFPGISILILVLGFNLLGDGLRNWLSPRKD